MSTGHKDFFGRKAEIGDLFCYAMRAGNSSEIAVGIVINSDGNVWNAKKNWSSTWSLNSRRSAIGGDDNMVLVKDDSLPADIVAALRTKVEAKK
jgi:hypothetical protein